MPIAEGEQPTVVVADDDPALRLLCRVNLELDGYRVLEAASRAELLAVLQREDVRAVLLDVHLGADDGILVARELVADHPNVGVAFFSGSVQGLEERTEELSAELLSKPFTLRELTETVARLVLPAPRS